MTNDNFWRALLEAQLPPEGKAFLEPQAGLHLVRWGHGVPTGTADAMLYINLDGVTTGTVFYGNVAGTWTVLTVS